MPRTSYVDFRAGDRFLLKGHGQENDIIHILSVEPWVWIGAGGTRVRYYYENQGPEYVVLIEAKYLLEFLVDMRKAGKCIKLDKPKKPTSTEVKYRCPKKSERIYHTPITVNLRDHLMKHGHYNVLAMMAMLCIVENKPVPQKVTLNPGDSNTLAIGDDWLGRHFSFNQAAEYAQADCDLMDVFIEHEALWALDKLLVRWLEEGLE